jgi:magnesium chelatase family protein
MLARRVHTILPRLTFEEALEITKIHSIAGTLDSNSPIMTTRPIRSPHHTATTSSIIGGGKFPMPGEISLAHYGVLFLDELPEFNRNTLEVLRGPLEDKKVSISRVNGTITYPCNFMLIASMNPCMCGYYGSSEKECICSPQSIRRYLGRISGPLLDRIDIHIEVKPIKYQKLENGENVETSAQIQARVNEARKIQVERYRKLGIFSNSELTAKLIEKYCKLGPKESQILKNAFETFGLSARAYSRILKVARTIADLEKEERINCRHLAEAIQYRSLDRKYGDI